jgi:hypothetical protein
MKKTNAFVFGLSLVLSILSACSKQQVTVAPTAEQIAKNSTDLIAYLDGEYEKELQASPEEMTSQAQMRGLHGASRALPICRQDSTLMR